MYQTLALDRGASISQARDSDSSCFWLYVCLHEVRKSSYFLPATMGSLIQYKLNYSEVVTNQLLLIRKTTELQGKTTVCLH